jgi:hypothetical protein
LRTPLSVNGSGISANPTISPNYQITSAKAMPVDIWIAILDPYAKIPALQNVLLQKELPGTH